MTLFSRLLSFLGLRRLPDAPPPVRCECGDVLLIPPRIEWGDGDFIHRATSCEMEAPVATISIQTKPVAYGPVYVGGALASQSFTQAPRPEVQHGVLVPLLSVRRKTGPVAERGPKAGCGPECLGCFHCAVTKN